ncbi:MAG: peptidylprolyl isomerase [bacterium]
METSMGTIKFKFYRNDAPETVKNFIKLAEKKYYDKLIFHRVIKGFMIQGGCPLGTGTGDPGYKIKGEFNSNKHIQGTVAMARAQHPDSAGSQFYICLEPCPFLDGQYTVFGQVIEGMDVVTKIGDVQTSGNQHTGTLKPPFDKPLKDVVMTRVYVEENEKN